MDLREPMEFYGRRELCEFLLLMQMHQVGDRSYSYHVVGDSLHAVSNDRDTFYYITYYGPTVGAGWEEIIEYAREFDAVLAPEW